MKPRKLGVVPDWLWSALVFFLARFGGGHATTMRPGRAKHGRV
jgi:hypothetical protein